MSAASPATRNDLLAHLARLGIETRTHDHPPLFTVAQSQALRGDIPGGHTKNLLLKDKKGALFLLVALEDTPVDMKSLHKLLGCARLSFASADLLMEVLGVPAGSVTPFALINDPRQRVSVLLDKAMMAQDPLNFHPLTNEATTSISRDGLRAFIRACGHEPRIIDLAPPGEAGVSGAGL